MLSTSSLREKEIINFSDGRRLGFIYDIEVNLEKGRIEALIVPGPGKFLGLFGKENDIYILWKDIRKIGVDVILVEIKDVIITEDEKEKEKLI